MKWQLRNPWLLTLLAIFVCGLAASLLLLHLSAELTAIQYTAAFPEQGNYLNSVTLNTLGLPLVFALTAGSVIALLGLAALERMRQPRQPRRTN